MSDGRARTTATDADATGPACPVCRQGGVPLLYGLPTPEARDAAEDGALLLGGCVVLDDDEQWACPAGHRWPAGDRKHWTSVVRLALRGRPRCPSCGGPTAQILYPGDADLADSAADLFDGAAVLAGEEPPADGPRPRYRCTHCAR